MRLLADLLPLLLAMAVIGQGQPAAERPGAGKVPLWLKVAVTAFVAMLVPVYWDHYGPGNFLWFSNLSLFLLAAALWLECPLLAGIPAVGVGVLELAWVIDFVGRLLLGERFLGFAEYMFDPNVAPLSIRLWSLYHLPLPFVLFWLVWRLGYDGRAFLGQTALAWVVLPLSYWLTEPGRNVNWVHGPGAPQEWVAPALYLLGLMAFLPAFIYLPTHLALSGLAPKVHSPRRLKSPAPSAAADG